MPLSLIENWRREFDKWSVKHSDLIAEMNSIYQKIMFSACAGPVGIINFVNIVCRSSFTLMDFQSVQVEVLRF